MMWESAGPVDSLKSPLRVSLQLQDSKSGRILRIRNDKIKRDISHEYGLRKEELIEPAPHFKMRLF
jgi:hypothetical protein